MKIGTKSLLFGAHMFWWHPLLVAFAWYKLYGWHWVDYVGKYGTLRTGLKDWRLWLALLVHDWGYWGSPDMDGARGERHPFRGAEIMVFSICLFDTRPAHKMEWQWYTFMANHSRAVARRDWWLGGKVSPLGAADKLSLALEPWWFYLLRVRLTGEIREYQSTPRHAAEKGFVGYDLPKRGRSWAEDKRWWMEVRKHLKNWAEAHVISSSISQLPLRKTSE